MKVEIKSIGGTVLFAAEVADDAPDWRRMRDAMEQAVKAGAYLGGANLGGANLGGANLRDAYLRDAYLGGAYLRDAYLGGANLGGANLGGAYLRDANLGGANLGGAYLGGADLRDANLGGAYLRDANLGGANLGGAYLGGANLGGDAKLTGERPIITIGPIGSRNATLTVFRTDKGVRVHTGCFFGSDVEFLARVAEEHADSRHGVDYRAAMAFALVTLGSAT